MSQATTHQAPPDAEIDHDALIGDHNYDGIQEYDNPIPGWWSYIFVASIFFGVFYTAWYHAPSMDRGIIASYDKAYAANLEQQFGEIGQLTGDAATVMQYIDDPKWLAVGQATFAANCVSCHGTNALGGSGPNLKDEHYIHIKNVEDIVSILNNGAAAGAMPAWSTRLHPNAIVLTASYVASMRGTANGQGKAPESNAVVPPPWDAEE